MNASQNKADDRPKDLIEANIISSTAEIIQMEAKLNKMKKFMKMESQLKKNRDEFNKLCQEISEAEQQLKNKKRDRINQKLVQIHLRNEQRTIKNKQSNQILAKLKEDQKERRKRMESLVSQYKQQYDYVYHKKLSQRRQNARFNFQDIFEHQRQYLKSVRKYSYRIKTQSLQKSRQKYTRQQQFLERSLKDVNEDNILKRSKIMQLVNKRIEYGNKVQRQSTKIKIPSALIQKLKVETNTSGYDKNIDHYNRQKEKYKKAKLDTNFNGDVQLTRERQIQKIAAQQSPTADKLNRLKHIVDGFNLQYANGQIEALDLMSNASIARANLLLKES